MQGSVVSKAMIERSEALMDKAAQDSTAEAPVESACLGVYSDWRTCTVRTWGGATEEEKDVKAREWTEVEASCV